MNSIKRSQMGQQHMAASIQRLADLGKTARTDAAAAGGGEKSLEDHNVTPPMPSPIPPIIPRSDAKMAGIHQEYGRLEDHNVTPVLPGPIPPIEPAGSSLAALAAPRHDAFVAQDAAAQSRLSFDAFRGALAATAFDAKPPVDPGDPGPPKPEM